MKELTKVNDYYEGKTKLYSDVDKTLDYLFPELKESDDERIRKELIWGFKHLPEETFAGISINDIISWLEKQYKKDEEIILLKDKIESLESARIAMQECHRLELEKLEKQDEQKYMKTCAEYYNQDNELKMPELSEFENKLADILMYREYDGPDETEDDIAKGRLEYELAAIRLSEELLPLAQKEQKPVDKVEPKFKVGNWIVYNDNLYHVGNIALQRYYECLRVDGTVHTFSLDIDSKSHLWTIQDAKDGDVLSFNDGHGNDSIELIKSVTGKKIEFWFCLTNGNRYEVFDGVVPYTNFASREDATPATKEQRDLLFQKMKEAGYEWNAEKKELKKIEQKFDMEIPFGAKDSELLEASYCIPEGFHAEIKDNKVFIKKGEQKLTWSEEDEKLWLDAKALAYEVEDRNLACWIMSIKDRVQPKQEWSEDDIRILTGITNYIGCSDLEGWEEWYNWLKFLKGRVQPKHQTTWKPDSAMIVSLQYAINHIHKEGDKNILSKLLGQLKKLKEE